ncbi:DUF3455 domain-containing protein [Rubrivivax sp. JA1026]|uniref:DUF3455 domain-containing protein n=1 Tax=Rubrivivax sp. JA1026 TaxID=2710888 RepID=UPI0013E91443|nr:DUF3455 domain-containing protein [Rubrivivax sp. JA1026]
MHTALTAITALGLTLTLAACGGMARTAAPAFDQGMLPAAVQVPAGHRVVWETVGVGRITYECRAKTGGAGNEWAFVGPDAELRARDGKAVGRYYGPPATWETADGQRLTGSQLAVAPAAAGSIPLQLVKATAPMQGPLAGVSHVQRVATRGGVAPARTCDATTAGQREVVGYQADYIFWKPV